MAKPRAPVPLFSTRIETPKQLADLGEEMLREQLAGDAYPHLRAVAVDLMRSHFVYAKEFEFGLDLVIGGLARTVAKSRSS
jgi:hypothetical protein